METLIFAAIAVFFAIRLFAALGKDEHSHHEDLPAKTTPDSETKDVKDNVVPLSKKIDLKKASKNKNLKEKIRELQDRDPEFNDQQFLAGAAKAFEAVQVAFAEADFKTLQNLLDDAVFKAFKREIEKREARQESHSNRVVAINNIEIKNIELNKDTALITVEFESEQIMLVKDKENRIIEGDPQIPEKLNDVWTFAREVQSYDPNWKLVSTSD